MHGSISQKQYEVYRKTSNIDGIVTECPRIEVISMGLGFWSIVLALVGNELRLEVAEHSGPSD